MNEGWDIIKLEMEKYILNILLPHLNHWGYYVLFLMTFLETSAFLGFLVPGESMVVIAGLLTSKGVLELGDVIWVASFGAIVGDTVGYFIGRRFGERFFLKYGKFFFFKKEYLDEAKGFFDRHGGKTVFLGRFMAWLRAFAPVVAGITKMRYPRFLFFNVSGGIVWATTFSLLGYFVGNSWDIIKIYLGRIGIFGFIFGVIIIYLYFLFTKKKRLIKEKIGWIDRRLSAQMPKTWEFVKGRFSAGEWYGLNLTIALVLFVLTLFSFGEVVEDLMDKETLFYLDFRVRALVEETISPEIIRFMVDITNIGGVYLAILTVSIIALYLLYKRCWWKLFAFFLVAGGGETILIILKILFHRPRPMPQLVAAHGYSFPSGHAFSAMTIYGFLIYLTWKMGGSTLLRIIILSAFTLLIFLIGISRIYLNVHYLTDILGGYASGLAWLIFCVVIVSIVQQYYKR